MIPVLILSILISVSSLGLAKEAQRFEFLSEAEDVEKEMWWIVTGSRSPLTSSPWRSLQWAMTEFESKKKPSLVLSSCKRFRVEILKPGREWRVSTLCRSEAPEIGSLLKKTAQEWQVEIPLAAWTEHFGIGVSIFHPRLLCYLSLNEKGRLTELRCPTYARNRKADEIIELENFIYQKGKVPLMKIKGLIKQPPETLGKIEATVPLRGDIQISETRYPLKNIKEALEFTDNKEGEKIGEKESKPKSQQEVPPIDVAPPPSR